MNKDYQEHELTAYLLDELDDKRREEIAEILKNSENAREKLEELRETIEEVGEALADEPAIRLTDEQRQNLEAQFGNFCNVAVAIDRRSRSRLTRWAVPLAAAASLIVVFLLSVTVIERTGPLAPRKEAPKQELTRLESAPVPPAETPAAAARTNEAREREVLSEAKDLSEQEVLLPRLPAPTARSVVNAVPAFKGKVTDASGAPLRGAVVQVASGESKPVETIQTDSRGQFAVPPLPQGEYKIQASRVGFKPNQVPVRAEEGKTKQVQLALQVAGDRQAMGQVIDPGGHLSYLVDEGVNARTVTSPPTSNPAKDSKGVVGGVAGGVVGGVVGGIFKNEVPQSYAIRGGKEEEQFNTEAYDYQADNEMTAVAKDPLSTFSIDVDTASYSNVRRFLREGQLPPPDAVRIEEMINYFPYDYEPPHDRTPFAVATEVAQAPWALDHRLVRIALKGRELPPNERPDTNLVFLLDVSGSMDSPVKLPLVKQAMRLLVDKLENRDRVAIVVYAGSSGLVLPSTSGGDKQRILDAIEQLEAGGSTNGAAGIQLAYREALANFKRNGINRVILATDGDFNVGTTNQGELVRLVQEEAAKGIYLTALGFGMGNYKDSMLEKLADKGNGNYAYIDSVDEARKVLVEQVGGTLVTIAKDVKIQVEFNPLEVTAYRLIGYENRVMAHQDFDNDRKDAGEIGAGHTVTALYEVVPAGVPVDLPEGDPLKYQRKTPAATPRGELLTVKLRYKLPNEEASRKLEVPVVDSMQVFNQASDDFRFAAAVAGFGMILRNSPFKGTATFQSIMRIADTSRHFDPQGYRAEFVRLVGEANRLAGE